MQTNSNETPIASITKVEHELEFPEYIEIVFEIKQENSNTPFNSALKIHLLNVILTPFPELKNITIREAYQILIQRTITHVNCIECGFFPANKKRKGDPKIDDPKILERITEFVHIFDLEEYKKFESFRGIVLTKQLNEEDEYWKNEL